MKHKLTYDNQEKFNILRIVSAEKDFKLAFLFNETLHLSLKRARNISKPVPIEGVFPEFPLFYWVDDLNRNGYYLIANRFQDNFLIIDKKNPIDYFFIIESERNTPVIKDLIKKLRACREILGVFEIADTSSTVFSDFFQDLEIHITKIKKEAKKPEEDAKKSIIKNRTSRFSKDE